MKILMSQIVFYVKINSLLLFKISLIMIFRGIQIKSSSLGSNKKMNKMNLIMLGSLRISSMKKIYFSRSINHYLLRQKIKN